MTLVTVGGLVNNKGNFILLVSESVVKYRMNGIIQYLVSVMHKCEVGRLYPDNGCGRYLVVKR